MEDHSKLQLVQDFLIDVYGNEKPPIYEINSFTVNKLYECALAQKKHIAETKVILDYKHTLATEYAIQVAQTVTKLQAYGYSLEILPPSFITQLQHLAEIAVQLNLKDMKLSSFLIGLTELQHRVKLLSEELEKEQKAHDIMVARMKVAVSLLGEAQEAKFSLGASFGEQQKQALSKFAANQQYLASKRAEYEAKLGELQTHLDAHGVSEDIRHSSLVVRSAQLEQLSKDMEPKAKLLQTYLDLPPDEKLAKKKIAEARQRLLQLEERLSRSIGDLQL